MPATGSRAKKTGHATEQDRPDVLKRREAWFEGQLDLDPNKLAFIDETWASTNMACRHRRCRRGQRLRAGIPFVHWKNTTFTAGLRCTGMVAPRVLDGPINADAFLSYVTRVLAPESFRPCSGGRLVMRGPSTRPQATVGGLGRRMRPCSGTVFADRLVERAHILRLSRVATWLRHFLITPFQTDKPVEGAPAVRAAIEGIGATLLFLPPYSPDFNPIEQPSSKLKAILRKAAERIIYDLWNAIGRILDLYSPQECANYFAACEHDAD